MKKIYFVGPTLKLRGNRGGATIKNEYLLNYLTKKNFSITIIETDNWKKNFFSIFFKILKMFFSINNNKIILSTSSQGTYLFLKMNSIINLFKKKVYYFVIGGDTPLKIKSGQFKKKYYTQLEKIFIETQGMQKMMIELGLNQTEYLPNFKEFEEKNYFERKQKKSLKCIFFSRITQKKGVDLIFEIIKKIDEDLIQVDFYGPIDEKYEADFHKNISSYKNTYYKGVLDTSNKKTYDIIEGYDLMLFPTYWEGEGFPGTLIDSFIAGVPVIASDWNYNVEIIKNEKTGLLFKAKDKIDFLEKINFLLKNPILIEKMRKNCYEESKKYHRDKLLEKVIIELIK